jgi:hypothetical protein
VLTPIDIYDIGRLLATPEPKWLITDFLRHQEVGVIYGPPNAGKSFLALDWALHVAAGVPWRGHEVEQTPVVYFAGEGAFSLQRRIRAWLLYHKQDAPPVYFQTRPVDFRDPDIIEQAREALSAYHSDHGDGLRPKLLIVDTLSQFFGGGEENGPDMAQFVAHCRYLAQEEQCAVLVVHHTNKGGVSERGHTALRGNSDVMYSIAGEEKQSLLSTILLTNDKNRDNPKIVPERIPLELIQWEEKTTSRQSRQSTPRVYTSSLVISSAKTSPVYQSLLDKLDESLSNLLYLGGTVEDTYKELIEHTDWLTVYTKSRAWFYREHAKLVKFKAIKAAGNGKSKFTPEGREAWFRIQKSIVGRL